MGYHLQTDGIDDYLRTPPGITVNKIIMDMAIDFSGTSTHPYLFDARGGTPAANFYSNGMKQYNSVLKGSGISSLTVGGVEVGAGLAITSNQRYLIEAILSSSVTVDANGIEFFCNNTLSYLLKGQIYSISGYNAGVLVFSYDMTLGNVQDQSGNGNHATLVGGTWVQEGGATYNQGTGSASITPSGGLVTRFSVTQTTGEATLTPSSALVTSLIFAHTIGEAIITPVGTIVKMIGKGVGSAIITPAGNIIKQTTKTVGSAALTPVGILSKGFLYLKTVGEAILTPSSTVEGVKMRIALVSGRINRAIQSLKNFFH